MKDNQQQIISRGSQAPLFVACHLATPSRRYRLTVSTLDIAPLPVLTIHFSASSPLLTLFPLMPVRQI